MISYQPLPNPIQESHTESFLVIFKYRHNDYSKIQKYRNTVFPICNFNPITSRDVNISNINKVTRQWLKNQYYFYHFGALF